MGFAYSFRAAAIPIFLLIGIGCADSESNKETSVKPRRAKEPIAAVEDIVSERDDGHSEPAPLTSEVASSATKTPSLAATPGEPEAAPPPPVLPAHAPLDSYMGISPVGAVPPPPPGLYPFIDPILAPLPPPPLVTCRDDEHCDHRHHDGDRDHCHKDDAAVLRLHDLWLSLWEEHVSWTRSVIFAILDDLESSDEYIARLLQNAEDMEDAFETYYGKREAEEIGDLLTAHLTIAAEILVALNASNEADLNDAIERWYENGRDIAEKLAELNPKFWPFNKANALWKDHLDHTIEEAQIHFSGDFEQEIIAVDHIIDQAHDLANFISDGIVKQFRHRFCEER